MGRSVFCVLRKRLVWQRTSFGVFASAFAIAAVVHAPALADDYPTKAIRWVVPSPAGSPVDVIARKLSEGVAAKIHGVIIVDNRPGASGTIGANEVSKAAPDGYTMAVAIGDPFTTSVALMKAPPYNPLTAFKYISKVAEDGPVLIASPTFAPNTLQEVVAAAKNSDVSYGSFGPGSFPQIIMEALSQQTGAKFQVVHYRGSPPAIQALTGNEIPLTFSSPSLTRAMVADGKVKPIAVVGKGRSTVMPDVPTFAESGIEGPIFRDTVWIGLAGPAALPASIVDKTYEALKQALAEPAMQKYFSEIGFTIVGNSPSDFENEVKSEYTIVDQLIKKRGISIE
jgi:tripartite-type tricarboxylate transporter receptor subunit TctC